MSAAGPLQYQQTVERKTNLKVEWRVFVFLLGGEFSELSMGPLFLQWPKLFIYSDLGSR